MILKIASSCRSIRAAWAHRSAGRSEGGRGEADAEGGGDAGLRQDESRGPVEFGLGRVLRDAPAWTEAIIAASLPVYTSGVLSPKLAELLSIAVDASINHMYAPGTRRHIQTALKLGVTVEEIMEVLKICTAQGMQACNLGVPSSLKNSRNERNSNHPSGCAVRRPRAYG